MKQNFYWILAAGVFAVILGGCKNKSSQDKVFKGEWAYTAPDPDTDPNRPSDSTTDYYLNLDLYKKNDIVEKYCNENIANFTESSCSCYGLYQATSEVEGTELAIDSILFLSADSASVLATCLEYPEEPKFELQFKYNEKDGSLTMNATYPNGSVVRETLPKYDSSKERK